VTVEYPDTAIFYNYSWHTTPIHSTTSNPVAVRVGYGAPRWSGRTGNSETTIHLAPDAYDAPGDFISMQGDIAPGPLPYSLFSEGSHIDTGSIDFPYLHVVAKDLSVLPGSYDMEIVFDRFKILDVPGKATALLSFNTTRADKNPPWIRCFQILSHGAPAEYISPEVSEIKFVMGDSTSVDSVGISYRAMGSPDWQPAVFERRGDTCRLDLLSLVADGYTSLKIRAKDPADNALQYTIEPAFMYRFFTFNPETLWFGGANLHDFVQRSLTLTNPLSVPVNVSSITASDSQFSIIPTQCTIQPQESQVFTVSFRPLLAGIQSCEFSFIHEALPRPTQYYVAGLGIDRRYRTFLPDSIIQARDQKGQPKGERQKADRVEFSVPILNHTGYPSTTLHIEFDQKLLEGTFSADPPFSQASQSGRGLKWDIVFPQPIQQGSSVTLSGFGSMGRVLKVIRHWWVVNGVAQWMYAVRPLFLQNVPRLPMPNLNNVGESIYRMAGSQSLGIIVAGGIKAIRHPTYKDVLNTLSKRGLTHTLDTTCIDKYVNGRVIKGNQRSLTPDKHNNVLLADKIAFEMAIKASDLSLTPEGFGDLIFNDSTSNPLNSLTMREISSVCDSFLILCTEPRPGVTARGLDSTILAINNAFSGPFDTLSFGKALKLTGIRSLWTVPFIHFNYNARQSAVRRYMGYETGMPAEYALYQNYPNPFNPLTTIRFSLPEPAFVTLRIYNLLGQLVTTLLDHEAMSDDDHEVVFNAGNFASGVYFYRISTEGIGAEDSPGRTFMDVRKMLLIK